MYQDVLPPDRKNDFFVLPFITTVQTDSFIMSNKKPVHSKFMFERRRVTNLKIRSRYLRSRGGLLV